MPRRVCRPRESGSALEPDGAANRPAHLVSPFALSCAGTRSTAEALSGPTRERHSSAGRVSPQAAKPLYSRASLNMSVLERFASPIRSRDAAVRLKAVQKHPADDAQTLADLARSDPDARVRKEAVRRLEAPRVLLELTESAGDEVVRRLARIRGETLLVKIAADDRDEGESRRALGLLNPPRAVAEVACRAHFEPIRAEALARLIGIPAGAADRDEALATVAGRATEPVLRSQALAAIASPPALLHVAIAAEDRESAQAAVRRLEDPGLLLTAATSSNSRNVRRLARRRADERLPPDHPERVERREKELSALLEQLADADPAHPSHNESLLADADALVAAGPVATAFTTQLEELREGLEGGATGAERATRLLVPGREVPPETAGQADAEAADSPPDVPPEVEEILIRLENADSTLGLADLDAAERECRKLLEGRVSTTGTYARLRSAVAAARDRALQRKKVRVQEFQVAELADHAVSLKKSLGERPSGPEIAQGRRELTRLVRRFDRMGPSETPDTARFRAAVGEAEQLLDAADSAHQNQVRKSEARIATLEERLSALESADPFPVREAEAALRDLGVIRNSASLWRRVDPERQTRFQRLQAALIPRLREARELREWRHWSNLEEQVDLIRRAKALAEVKDLQRVDRELTALERAWHKARHTQRDRGQELWEEWGKTRGALLERIGPLREAAERELKEKLDGLQALAVKAEEIADGADPRRAAEIRSLMPAWRETARGIGKGSDRLWSRFRAANDRYFAELKTLRKKRYEEFAANIPIREELIGRARTLLDQSDADAVRSAVRDLMREWKEAPPVPRKEGDRLWEEFRGACDEARDRLRRPAEGPRSLAEDSADPLPRSEADAGLKSRIAELATQSAAKRRESALALWDEYRRVSRSTQRVARETEGSLLRSLRQVFEADPEAFTGTRLDQEHVAERLARLLAEIEELAQPRASVSSQAGVIDFAEHLKRTLQAGRAADRGAVLREDARTATRILERARAAGPALSESTTRPLHRIEELAQKVIARAPSLDERRESGRSRSRGRRPPRR